MNTLAIEVDPRGTSARCTDNELVVELSDGRTLSVPLAWFPRLLAANSADRNQIVLIGEGEGLHWPKVDEDLSVAGLLAGKPALQGLRAQV
jgi:hypothetical protein